MTLPEDPQSLLSAEAQERIRLAQHEMQTARDRVIAEIDLRNRFKRDGNFIEDLDHGLGAQEFHRAKVEQARVVLTITQAEFIDLGLPDERISTIMQGELEAAKNSLELSSAETNVLSAELSIILRRRDATKKLIVRAKPTASVPTREFSEHGTCDNSSQPGRSLDALLEEKGFSDEGWAQAAGVDPKTVWNVRHGKSRPIAQTKKRLADALAISVDDLSILLNSKL